MAQQSQDEAHDDARIGEGVPSTAVREGVQDGGHRRSQEEVAEPVDPLYLVCKAAMAGMFGVEEQEQQDRAKAAEGQVDVEHPPPGNLIDENAAQKGADDGPEDDEQEEDAKVLAALPQRQQVAEDQFDEH